MFCEKQTIFFFLLEFRPDWTHKKMRHEREYLVGKALMNPQKNIASALHTSISRNCARWMGPNNVDAGEATFLKSSGQHRPFLTSCQRISPTFCAALLSPSASYVPSYVECLCPTYFFAFAASEAISLNLAAIQST